MQFYSSSAIRSVLDETGGSIRKSLGQNFLIDPNQIEKMVHAITQGNESLFDRPVLEIGPGLGALTYSLLNRLKIFKNISTLPHVVSVEIDRILASILKNSFSNEIDNGELIIENEDALAFFKNSPDFKIHVGNLPYYITTDLILSSIQCESMECAYFLVQSEYAARLCATGSDSSLTVYMANLSDSKELFKVSAGCFYPRPSVESSYIEIRKKSRPHCNPELLEQILRMSYHARRKKLSNTWKNSPDQKKDHITIQLDRLMDCAKSCEINTEKRAEQIEHEAFFELVNCYESSL